MQVRRGHPSWQTPKPGSAWLSWLKRSISQRFIADASSTITAGEIDAVNQPPQPWTPRPHKSMATQATAAASSGIETSAAPCSRPRATRPGVANNRYGNGSNFLTPWRRAHPRSAQPQIKWRRTCHKSSSPTSMTNSLLEAVGIALPASIERPQANERPADRQGSIPATT